MVELPKNIPGLNKASVGRLTPAAPVPTIHIPKSVELTRLLKRKQKPGTPRNRARIGFKILVYGLAIIVDIAQIVLNFFAVGLAVNRIIDIVFGCLLAAIMYIKGLSLAEHSKLYISVLGTLLVEEIPVVDIAPAWTIDAWYIIRTIQKEDAVYNENGVKQQSEGMNRFVQAQIAKHQRRVREQYQTEN
jgi:hypothetical protein